MSETARFSYRIRPTTVESSNSARVELIERLIRHSGCIIFIRPLRTETEALSTEKEEEFRRENSFLDKITTELANLEEQYKLNREMIEK